MIEIISELNDILVESDSMVAPTKSKGIAIKDGFLVQFYKTWREVLETLVTMEYLSSEEELYFLEKISTSEYSKTSG